MKKIVIITSLALLSLIMLACSKPAPTPAPAPAPQPTIPAPAPAPAPTSTTTTSAPKVEPVVIKALTGFPKTHPDFQDWSRFADLVTKKSGGELKIDYLGALDVMPREEMAMAVRKNVAQMCMLYNSSYTQLVPSAAVVSISQISPAEERKRGVISLLDAEHNKVGLHLLGRGGVINDMYLVYSKKKIATKADFAGVRLAGPTMITNAVKNWGATPTMVTASEYYSSIQSGIADAFIRTPGGAVEISGWEVTKYIVDQYIHRGSHLTIVNLDLWNKLTPKQQQALVDAEIENEAASESYQDKLQADSRQQLISKGMEAVKLSADDAKWYGEQYYAGVWDWTVASAKDAAPTILKLKELLQP